MFTTFLQYGDFIAVILLCYAEAVGFVVASVNRDEMSVRLTQPAIVTSLYATLYVLATIPALFVLAFYAGSYGGFWAGFGTFFMVSIVTALISVLFGVRRNLGLHLLVAPIALIYGYVSVFSTWG